MVAAFASDQNRGVNGYGDSTSHKGAPSLVPEKFVEIACRRDVFVTATQLLGSLALARVVQRRTPLRHGGRASFLPRRRSPAGRKRHDPNTPSANRGARRKPEKTGRTPAPRPQIHVPQSHATSLLRIFGT
jgi:hypothetical protein